MKKPILVFLIILNLKYNDLNVFINSIVTRMSGNGDNFSEWNGNGNKYISNWESEEMGIT